MITEINQIQVNKERLKQFFFKDIFRDQEMCYKLYHEIFPNSEKNKRFVDFRVCPLYKDDYRYSKRVYKIQDGDSLLYLIFNDGTFGEKEQNELRHYVVISIYNEIRRRTDFWELKEKGSLSKSLKRKLPRFLIIQKEPYIKQKLFNYSSEIRWFLKIPYNVEIRVITLESSRSVLKKVSELNELIDKSITCTVFRAHHLNRLIYECTEKNVFGAYFREMTVRQMGTYILTGLEIEKREEKHVYLPVRF